MGTITIVHDNIRYVFEPSENETLKILMMLSGAKSIESELSGYNDAESTPLKEIVQNNTTPNTYVYNNKWYNPKQKEIMDFIKSRPMYQHTTKEVLSNFNPDKDITLSRQEDDVNKNVWYSVLQKLRTIRNNIERIEHGKWNQDRVGQEQVYTFNKY